MNESSSQCQQDLCVLEIIRKPGIFLDIGSKWPIKENNTYLLEKNGWRGVCIDIQYYDYSQRNNSEFLHGDAIKFLPSLKDTLYDYISLDIDENTNKALEVILQNNISFKFMTIEHDVYRLSKKYQDEQRELLYDSKYELLFSNIQPNWDNNIIFEDWWYNPKANLPVIKELESLGVLGSSYRSSSSALWLLQRARDKA